MDGCAIDYILKEKEEIILRKGQFVWKNLDVKGKLYD